MASLINKIKDAVDMKLDDQKIANSSLMSLKGSCAAYLGATLESATPEIRRMYGDYLTQCLQSHEALTNLAIKKGWYQPYLNPKQQVTEAFKQSQNVISANA